MVKNLNRAILIYLLILLMVFFSSCSYTRLPRPLPDMQINVSLLDYTYTSGHSATITSTTSKRDTVYLLYSWRGLGRMKFYRRQKFTVRYNRLNYKIIDGKRYYKSVIIINQ